MFLLNEERKDKRVDVQICAAIKYFEKEHQWPVVQNWLSLIPG